MKSSAWLKDIILVCIAKRLTVFWAIICGRMMTCSSRSDDGGSGGASALIDGAVHGRVSPARIRDPSTATCWCLYCRVGIPSSSQQNESRAVRRQRVGGVLCGWSPSSKEGCVDRTLSVRATRIPGVRIVSRVRLAIRTSGTSVVTGRRGITGCLSVTADASVGGMIPSSPGLVIRTSDWRKSTVGYCWVRCVVVVCLFQSVRSDVTFTNVAFVLQTWKYLHKRRI